MKFIVALCILCFLHSATAMIESRQFQQLKEMFKGEDIQKLINDLRFQNARQQGQINALMELLPDTAKSELIILFIMKNMYLLSTHV